MNQDMQSDRLDLNRCEFMCKKKNRKCKLLAKKGGKYCGEHLTFTQQNEQVKKTFLGFFFFNFFNNYTII